MPPTRSVPFALRIALTLLAGVAAPPLAAQTPSKPARLGLCASCHGDTGSATEKSIPNLAAQNIEYLRTAIRQYRSGARDVPAMRAATAMLSEAELDQLLQWYAAQPSAAPAR